MSGPEATLAYDEIPVTVSNMWLRLAKTVEEGIPDAYISSGPQAAIRQAWFAEACYWQARSEDASPNAKDIVALERDAPEPIPLVRSAA